MITNKLKISIVAVLISGFMSFTAASSFAAEAPLAATLEVLSVIQILNKKSVNFGNIEIPTEQNLNEVTVDPGGQDGGSVELDGTANETVDMSSATTGACSPGTGVTLSAILFDNAGSFNATETITLDTGGLAISLHGATVTVTSGATAGTKTCAYDIIANY